MKFFKNILSIYYYIRGREKLREENMLEALEFFRKAEEHGTNYELLIHKGLVEFLLNMFDNSVVTLQYALVLVQDNTKINNDEKCYLEHYILDTLIYALKILHRHENLYKYEQLLKKSSFNKAKIRTQFLRDFPIQE